MSNSHEPEETKITKKKKDGSPLQDVASPVTIAYYNKYMGEVDHADQIIGLYDLDRKSQKWWRKVFFDYCLLLCIIPTSFFVKPITKIPYIGFFMKVAENIIEEVFSNNLDLVLVQTKF